MNSNKEYNQNKDANSHSKHEIQISFQNSKENTNSYSSSNSSQKTISISKPSHDKGTILFTNIKNSQPIKPKPNQSNQIQHNTNQFDFTEKELEMQEIAKQNQQIILSNQFQITDSQTIFDNEHYQISIRIRQLRPSHQHTPIIVNNLSTIGATIEIHKNNSYSICILNFADPFKPGGGYLNGRSPQEETICRQTLLYPTLLQSQMYSFNQANPATVYLYDTMIYSANVHVIRDDNYLELNENTFMVNVISAPAVDNRKNSMFYSSEEIMERRIRKIISLAIDKKNDAIVLGAFGCGVFKNDPDVVSQIFKKILVDEGLKDFFNLVVFPIYKNEVNYEAFKDTFGLNSEEE